MIEIYQNLFVGNQDDYELTLARQGGWAVIHACKDPYHRAALGYRGRGAPKDHPEYLVARRGDRLILNLVDADNPAYIPQEIIDAAQGFISEKLAENLKVLVHCNQGMSRSPSIGLLYLFNTQTSCLKPLLRRLNAPSVICIHFTIRRVVFADLC